MRNASTLLILLLFWSCSKSTDESIPATEDHLGGWSFMFTIVDSLGNSLFDPLPPNSPNYSPLSEWRDTIPFDPNWGYFIDGFGVKRELTFGGTEERGLIFNAGKFHHQMIEEQSTLVENTYTWLLYYNRLSAPDTLQFANPLMHASGGNGADFYVVNSDTLLKNESIVPPVEIVYHPK